MKDKKTMVIYTTVFVVMIIAIMLVRGFFIDKQEEVANEDLKSFHDFNGSKKSIRFDATKILFDDKTYEIQDCRGRYNSQLNYVEMLCLLKSGKERLKFDMIFNDYDTAIIIAGNTYTPDKDHYDYEMKHNKISDEEGFHYEFTMKITKDIKADNESDKVIEEGSIIEFSITSE